MPEIKLSKGYVASVDAEDVAWLSQYRWFAHVLKTGAVYARGRVNGKLQYMHRLLCPLTHERPFCDHEDGDGLNNRRYNLRAATRSENNRHKVNKSGKSSRYVGVSWAKNQQKWHALIRSGPNGKQVGIGYFKDECDAATAYNFAAEAAFGDFAVGNLPAK